LPYSAPNYNDIFREGGRIDLVDDERLQTAASRNAASGALYAEVAPIIATRSTAFWVEFCQRHDIPAGAVRTLEELTAELPVARHPTAGSYHRIPSPVRFSATPASVHREAPMLGEHGTEVLREVGLDEAAVVALIEAKALLRHE
jgi:crotonobetainyl-CoA:carnitine CoA-transferase CaiB-like acyl-CoA transferase